MKSSIYEFDSEGDVTIILKTGRSKFHWDNDTLWLVEPDEWESVKEGLQISPSSTWRADTPLRRYSNKTPPDLTGFLGPSQTGAPELVVDKGFFRVANRLLMPQSEEAIENAEFGLDGSKQEAETEDPDSDDSANNNFIQCWESRYQMRVSSRHLILASHVFRSMLRGPWMENQANDSGIRQITASSWDHDAMVILLDIIHNHHRAVPRSLDLETLTRLAIIVDYYKCHEPTEVFVEMWLEKIGRKLPNYHGKESTLWLVISWVFSRNDIFNKMARLAVGYCKYPYQTRNLPIPSNILIQIDEKRQECVAEIFSSLYDLIDTLSNPSGCSFECSAMQLGSLMKEMKRCGILSPRISKPFFGHSLKSIIAMVQDFKRPMWSRDSDYSGFSVRRCGCTIQKSLQPVIEKIEWDLEMWSIGDF